MNCDRCQIFCLEEMSEPMRTVQALWQRLNRLKRILKRRWHYLTNRSSEAIGAERTTTDTPAEHLQPGDVVRIRSREEIRATLNGWNQLKGCTFVEEMWPYCGTTQRVLKRVQRFLDERDYLVKKCRGIVVLDGVMCEGSKDFGRCDRSCFYFWREEWLTKVDDGPQPMA